MNTQNTFDARAYWGEVARDALRLLRSVRFLPIVDIPRLQKRTTGDRAGRMERLFGAFVTYDGCFETQYLDLYDWNTYSPSAGEIAAHERMRALADEWRERWDWKVLLAGRCLVHPLDVEGWFRLDEMVQPTRPTLLRRDLKALLGIIPGLAKLERLARHDRFFTPARIALFRNMKGNAHALGLT